MHLTRKVYASRNEKIIDFIIGVVLFIVLNGVMLGLYILTYSLSTNMAYRQAVLFFDLLTVLGSVPLLINLALFVLFAILRPWMAIGMIVAFSVLLILTLLAGVILTAYCLYSLGNYSY